MRQIKVTSPRSGKRSVRRVHGDINRLEEATPPAEIRIEGLNLFDREAVEATRADLDAALAELARLNSGHGSPNPFMRLKAYRINTLRMIRYLEAWGSYSSAVVDRQEQILGAAGKRNRARWTPLEDTVLVEQACEPEATILTLALHMNRTPGAVASRLTHLVGVKKMSREVAGRIIGALDGKPVEGYFEGVLTAEE